VPLTVNTVQFPFPKPQCCFDLGKAIRRAVDSFHGGQRVLILGTSGMSHKLQGDRAGFMQPEFDRMFLQKLRDDPLARVRIPIGDYMKNAGHEGAELIMWLVTRASPCSGSRSTQH
jgi:protocatechuate 4,5-dioxygenase, beta chain